MSRKFSNGKVTEMSRSNRIIDIQEASETRYTAGYRAHEEQIRENAQARVKRKEEALERFKRAFLRVLKKSAACIVSIAFGVLSMVAFEGDATFLLFTLIVGGFFLFDKEVFKK